MKLITFFLIVAVVYVSSSSVRSESIFNKYGNVSKMHHNNIILVNFFYLYYTVICLIPFSYLVSEMMHVGHLEVKLARCSSNCDASHELWSSLAHLPRKVINQCVERNDFSKDCIGPLAEHAYDRFKELTKIYAENDNHSHSQLIETEVYPLMDQLIEDMEDDCLTREKFLDHFTEINKALDALVDKIYE